MPVHRAIHVLCSVMVGINLLGNSLVCFVVLKNKSMRTTMNFLLVNLAVSDMMVGIFSTFRILITNPFDHLHGSAAHTACKILTGGTLMWMGILASVLFLVLIAVERYYAVLHPLQHQTGLVATKLKPVVLALWLYAFIWNIPTIALFRYNEKDKRCFVAWPTPYLAQVRAVWWVITTAVIPVIMMGYLYVQIVRKLRKTGPPGGVANGKARRKVTRMTLVISVIYIITWIPNSVIFLLLLFSSHVTPDSPADQLGILLVTFNSCINPVVYTLHSRPFSTRLRSMLKCCRRRAVAPTENAATAQRVDADVEVTSYENEYFVERGIESRNQLERSRESVLNEWP